MRPIQGLARFVGASLGRESSIIRRLRPYYESVLDRTSGGTGIPWTINGVTYRIDPRHRHRLGQEYEPPVAAFLRERVKPGAVCFDVGANVGAYVLQFAHWSQPTGRVVAFEPNAVARGVLQKHIAMNQLVARVDVVPAAVSAMAGEAILHFADSDGMSRLGAANDLIADRTSEIAVPVVTLDEYCSSHGIVPDWLLVDVEGFEFGVLRGARDLISRRGKALGLVVEMHPSVWPSADTTREQAEALLADLRLSVEPLTGQRDPLAEDGITWLSYH